VRQGLLRLMRLRLLLHRPDVKLQAGRLHHHLPQLPSSFQLRRGALAAEVLRRQ
jgi:hypothetical protein